MHTGPLPHLVLKFRGQVLGIPRQGDIQGDGQVGLYGPGGHHGAAEIELLPDRPHQIHVTAGRSLLELSGNLNQRRAGAPVVHGGARDLVAAQLLEGRLIDHRATDIDPHAVDLLGAGCSHVDEEGRNQIHLVFLFRGGGVVCLGTEDAGMPFAILAADHQLQPG